MSITDDDGLQPTDPTALRRDLDDLERRFEVVEDYVHSPRINEPLWFGWTRWRWMQAAYVFVTVVMAIAVWLTVENANDLERQAKREEFQRCLVTADAREGVRNLVFKLVEPPEGATLNPQQQARYDEIVRLTEETLPDIECVEGDSTANIRRGG